MWFRILKHVYKQPQPQPQAHSALPLKLGISLCILVIYKPTPLHAIATPLCIPNLVFHTNVSFLTLLFLHSVRRLLVMANVSSSQIVTLVMEALGSSKTSVLTRATWRNIPGNGILHPQFMFLP
jgi:hypothetical protein